MISFLCHASGFQKKLPAVVARAGACAPGAPVQGEGAGSARAAASLRPAEARWRLGGGVTGCAGDQRQELLLRRIRTSCFRPRPLPAAHFAGSIGLPLPLAPVLLPVGFIGDWPPGAAQCLKKTFISTDGNSRSIPGQGTCTLLTRSRPSTPKFSGN